jgi:hypothetical protein
MPMDELVNIPVLALLRWGDEGVTLLRSDGILR